MSGAYGVRDVCFSIPTVMGRSGVKSHIEVELWSKEKTALVQSANVLKETIAKVLSK
jgi:L-lactate dehydrogenase